MPKGTHSQGGEGRIAPGIVGGGPCPSLGHGHHLADAPQGYDQLRWYANTKGLAPRATAFPSWSSSSARARTGA
jgi:hypothetical protein